MLNFINFVQSDLMISKSSIRKSLDDAALVSVTASQRIFLAQLDMLGVAKPG